mmetsp:Transcript_8172/g.12647  ORF Transcript_8172/g.12647 Transcript_8172/m.12647 type:complete len:82 (-) Transcript_8172:175-420(-)
MLYTVTGSRCIISIASSSSSSSESAAEDDPTPIKCAPSSMFGVRLMAEYTIHDGVSAFMVCGRVMVMVGADCVCANGVADA